MVVSVALTLMTTFRSPGHSHTDAGQFAPHHDKANTAITEKQHEIPQYFVCVALVSENARFRWQAVRDAPLPH